MHFLILAASLLLSASGGHASSVTDQFVGKGRVLVLNSDNLEKAKPSDKVGCLNAKGDVVTLDQCAVFTRNETWPHELYSSAGTCTFRDTTTVQNLASVYGKGSYAFSCSDVGDSVLKSAMWAGEPYYTVDGFNFPFVCTGNLNCYYEIERVPTSDKDSLPVWEYFWGSQQMSVTPGHLQVMWLWDPVKDTSGVGGPKGSQRRSVAFRG
ncbi:hypothetical protein QBC47DRAFT_403909 [Echria macrotheca]|uniref:Uncharacterized protein n=1 Tax=Echria macrotheca TaxID=438768 RepID=A0AAJ0F4M8_9PEZI|nr:hypothetical protein QBC47DRAFT_403909 [Echria macrotheca]